MSNIEISAHWLRDSGGYLRLYHWLMPKVGHATVTFGAIRECVDAKKSPHATFRKASYLADLAQVSRRTYWRHVDTLRSDGLLETSRGHRRTTTIAIPQSIWGPLSGAKYVAFPRRVRFTSKWSAKFVYASVVSRLAMVESCNESGNGEAYERDRISIRFIERQTGLAHSTVCEALDLLTREELIKRFGWSTADHESAVFKLAWPSRWDVPSDLVTWPDD